MFADIDMMSKMRSDEFAVVNEDKMCQELDSSFSVCAHIQGFCRMPYSVVLCVSPRERLNVRADG